MHVFKFSYFSKLLASTSALLLFNTRPPAAYQRKSDLAFSFGKKSRSISSLLGNIFAATTILPKNFKVKDREEYTSKDCQLKGIPAERHL